MNLPHAIHITPIELSWSEWIPWESFLIRAGRDGSIQLPPEPGVYVVRRKKAIRKRPHAIYIGKAKNLRDRIRQQLVKGGEHRASREIREYERLCMLEISFAETRFRAAVEEFLLYSYHRKHDGLPRYNKHEA
jgi:excinuclease UvrABC nuclease subunit